VLIEVTTAPGPAWVSVLIETTVVGIVSVETAVHGAGAEQPVVIVIVFVAGAGAVAHPQADGPPGGPGMGVAPDGQIGGEGGQVEMVTVLVPGAGAVGQPHDNGAPGGPGIGVAPTGQVGGVGAHVETVTLGL
jgi:hypothetical protein